MQELGVKCKASSLQGTSSDQRINAAAGHEAVLRGVRAKVLFVVYNQCRHVILYGVHGKNDAPMILAAMSDSKRDSRCEFTL